ncbi:hypothetical protein [Rhodococcus sp. BH5]|uniref:hypothetical protein n=1 Tax=Rhodococcus sp. BH5 TaxID=2871702 RepID=UPI0022CD5CC6|nr:hypothetical protein [Rhodococcus sp. BH5]MCZ9635179.1 hypothetical protein [Rhodococcus sp. BH5]
MSEESSFDSIFKAMAQLNANRQIELSIEDILEILVRETRCQSSALYISDRQTYFQIANCSINNNGQMHSKFGYTTDDEKLPLLTIDKISLKKSSASLHELPREFSNKSSQLGFLEGRCFPVRISNVDLGLLVLFYKRPISAEEYQKAEKCAKIFANLTGLIISIGASTRKNPYETLNRFVEEIMSSDDIIEMAISKLRLLFGEDHLSGRLRLVHLALAHRVSIVEYSKILISSNAPFR